MKADWGTLYDVMPENAAFVSGDLKVTTCLAVEEGAQKVFPS
jgi:hypothetical protein